MYRLGAIFALIGLLLAACQTPLHTPLIKPDPHSFAKPEEARVVALDLVIQVDFDSQTLGGTAILEIEKKDRQTSEIWLDTKDLDIAAVTISRDQQNEIVADWRFGEADSILGTPLVISLMPNTRYVHIQYSSRPGAEALQFLPAELTSSGKPFLLTQSQSIFARTWIPIQDSPGIRFPYRATVKVDPELMAVMSATNPQVKNETGVYTFEMDQPIPAYLLALAVGDIEFASLGPRTGVYAEPALLEQSVYEFAEVEEMIDIAEGLYGPYAWERYDIIVLPPSFPFGGMENPRLTFATPTILAGDRSLVSLVAHELAHSWSGNLVTNATWDDFWLNEGFTVYVENRIMEALKGRDYAEMLAYISYTDLKSEVAGIGFGSPDTRLAYELAGRHPDDGFSSIPYDKGYYFLRLIEETVGRKEFDQFIKGYFTDNAFKSMSTDRFLERLEKELLSKHPEAAEIINIDAWVHTAGIPDNIPIAQSTRFKKVEEAVHAWVAGESASTLPTGDWTTHEWLHFIQVLPDQLSAGQMAKLDDAFHFTARTNSEIQAKWYTRAIKAQYEPAYPAIRTFLTSVGRRKFLTPLYSAMMAAPETKPMAEDIYAAAREGYHPIAQNSIDALVYQ